MLNPDIKLSRDKSLEEKLNEHTTGFLGLFLNGKVHVGMSRFTFRVLLISYAIFQLHLSCSSSSFSSTNKLLIYFFSEVEPTKINQDEE